jgi:hypothetical protein
MTVTVATRASTNRPASGSGYALQLQKAWGTVSLSTAFAPGDTLVMCKLPKGAIIVGGALLGEKWDSAGAGTACMTLNIGVDQPVITPQGTTVSTASTSDCLAAAWAIGSEIAAIPGVHPEASGRNIPLGGLLVSKGPLTCTDECNVIIKSITSAATTFTAVVTLTVDYYASTH